jgi:hypothetical protein
MLTVEERKMDELDDAERYAEAEALAMKALQLASESKIAAAKLAALRAKRAKQEEKHDEPRQEIERASETREEDPITAALMAEYAEHVNSTLTEKTLMVDQNQFTLLGTFPSADELHTHDEHLQSEVALRDAVEVACSEESPVPEDQIQHTIDSSVIAAPEGNETEPSVVAVEELTLAEHSGSTDGADKAAPDTINEETAAVVDDSVPRDTLASDQELSDEYPSEAIPVGSFARVEADDDSIAGLGYFCCDPESFTGYAKHKEEYISKPKESPVEWVAPQGSTMIEDAPQENMTIEPKEYVESTTQESPLEGDASQEQTTVVDAPEEATTVEPKESTTMESPVEEVASQGNMAEEDAPHVSFAEGEITAPVVPEGAPRTTTHTGPNYTVSNSADNDDTFDPCDSVDNFCLDAEDRVQAVRGQIVQKLSRDMQAEELQAMAKCECTIL